MATARAILSSAPMLDQVLDHGGGGAEPVGDGGFADAGYPRVGDELDENRMQAADSDEMDPGLDDPHATDPSAPEGMR
jgi:hypothetical protein